MGRETCESIGKPLPGRRNIVLSRAWTAAPAGFVLARSPDEALRARRAGARGDDRGRARRSSRRSCRARERIYLTEVRHAFEGDTHFPAFDRSQWVERFREDRPADAQEPVSDDLLDPRADRAAMIPVPGRDPGLPTVRRGLAASARGSSMHRFHLSLRRLSPSSSSLLLPAARAPASSRRTAARRYSPASRSTGPSCTTPDPCRSTASPTASSFGSEPVAIGHDAGVTRGTLDDQRQVQGNRRRVRGPDRGPRVRGALACRARPTRAASGSRPGRDPGRRDDRGRDRGARDEDLRHEAPGAAGDARARCCPTSSRSTRTAARRPAP